ncbi:hypothetical protein ABPG75_002857 [Micractinium tetrahymenae]
MGPLLALPVKRADLQKSNLGPAAAAAAAPAQLVHLWQPPSKEQLEIWQAVQAQAAAAAASAQAQRPAAALPLWQPVVLPPTSGLQHSPPKPPRPALSQPQQKASPVPRRRRPAARQPQAQQRARGRDTQWPQPAQHGQSQGLAAQQHEAPLPSEQQHNGAAAPAAAAEADATPAASTGGPPVSPELERVCVQAAQHLLQNMLAAFDKADDSSGESMLRPLRRLLLAGQGGRTLQDIVAGWAGYSLPQQQEIFNTAVLAAKTARWQDLEDQLRLALELIS